ncbi:hypothetical protein EVAR_46465_1 [Eumeta japonica]|uniref:Uncharacterized protein n=1 Tax=Eumeta variegata TaxID=151549 RepID=A0A4C1XFI1_EUMVA|nr:hypothetical protein EVAR_46465_1 [Eumeta japonica]
MARVVRRLPGRVAGGHHGAAEGAKRTRSRLRPAACVSSASAERNSYLGRTYVWTTQIPALPVHLHNFKCHWKSHSSKVSVPRVVLIYTARY